MERKKKIIRALILANVVLVCCVIIQIAGVIRGLPDSIAESVGNMLHRDVEYAGSRDGIYTLKTEISVPKEGTVTFQAINDNGLRTNYGEQAFWYIADAYFPEEAVSWEETEIRGLPAWSLTVTFPAQTGQSLEDFCGYMGEFTELCMDSSVNMRNGYPANEFPVIKIQVDGLRNPMDFSYDYYGYPGYTREDYEAELYDFLSGTAGGQTDAEDPGAASGGTDTEAPEARMEREHQEWMEESRKYIEKNMESYLKRKAGTVFRLENGREYRMIVTDYVMFTYQNFLMNAYR